MENVIERLHERALQISRRAARLWLVSIQMLAADNHSATGIFSALELNSMAIDECKQALNTIGFIQRYISDEDKNDPAD